MTDAQQYDEIDLPAMAVEVRAQKSGEIQYEGWVYIGGEIVFKHGGNEWNYAGIEDFAQDTLRTFTRRLAAILREPEST